MEASLTQVHPNRALGVLALGASLHDVITRLKVQPDSYPALELSYSAADPLLAPVVLDLPANGFRLRFDGPDQRLRLIEVLNFNKSRLLYKNNEIVKAAHQEPSRVNSEHPAPTGPTFRHVYSRLFGPTFPGEYVPPSSAERSYGTYILSYPGVAFSFPLLSSAWSSDKDFVSLLSSSAASPAVSMAIFSGSSWADARDHLFTHQIPVPRSPVSAARIKELGSEEVDLARIHSEGRIELIRRPGKPFWIVLGETTPQDLVAELGPPDAIYRKNDRRLSIHGAHTIEHSRSPATNNASPAVHDDLDQLSSQTNTDDSDDASNSTGHEARGQASSECFYNYFRHGFDVLISTPAAPSPPLPLSEGAGSNPSLKARVSQPRSSSQLVTTKVLLHGNVPGSYPFNRHRRIRWTLEQTTAPYAEELLDSETAFSVISTRLNELWKNVYHDQEEETQFLKGMVLNRAWGDSPGSSCELLGGWEESFGPNDNGLGKGTGETGNHTVGNTELFGFPGMVFEVLRSGAVSCLTVF